MELLYDGAGRFVIAGVFALCAHVAQIISLFMVLCLAGQVDPWSTLSAWHIDNLAGRDGDDLNDVARAFWVGSVLYVLHRSRITCSDDRERISTI